MTRYFIGIRHSSGHSCHDIMTVAYLNKSISKLFTLSKPIHKSIRPHIPVAEFCSTIIIVIPQTSSSSSSSLTSERRDFCSLYPLQHWISSTLNRSLRQGTSPFYCSSRLPIPSSQLHPQNPLHLWPFRLLANCSLTHGRENLFKVGL